MPLQKHRLLSYYTLRTDSFELAAGELKCSIKCKPVYIILHRLNCAIIKKAYCKITDPSLITNYAPTHLNQHQKSQRRSWMQTGLHEGAPTHLCSTQSGFLLTKFLLGKGQETNKN